MRILVIIALSATLAGCAEYQRAQDEKARAEYARMEAYEDGTCQSYGADPGSNAYIQCRMNLSNQRAQVAANDRAIILQQLLRR